MRKRLLAVFLALITVLIWSCGALAAGDMQTGSMYVNTANGRALRFRTEKNTRESTNIICEIPYGTKVYVISWDGTWAKVQYNGSKGYVVQKHLSIARPKEYSQVLAEKAAEEAAEKSMAQTQVQVAAQKQQQENLARMQQLQAAQRAAQAQAALQQQAQASQTGVTQEQSALKEVPAFDVTVVIGVVDMTASLYAEPSTTSLVLAQFSDGARLSVKAEDEEWAWVYDGAGDRYGYMLREDLVPDLEEDVLLDD